MGYAVAGNSPLAQEFRQQAFADAFVVFKDIPLPNSISESESRTRLLRELCRIHRLGWINSKQLDGNGTLKPCNAQQCGGYTLEAELGVPKNSKVDPDFLGWEVKQHSVSEFDRNPNSKAITLLTPEPNEGYYSNHGVEAFVRKFGYPDKSGKPDRFNFGGRHFVEKICIATNLEVRLLGFDSLTGRITNANGSVALVSNSGEIAAAWGFQKILEHWSRKHNKAVYVPSKLRKISGRQYSYGDRVRLAVGTNPFHLLTAIASKYVYYDPGIKLECASTNPKVKSRSQFRIASKNLSCLYDTMDTVDVCNA